jgi:putative inorganic carbon (hco3(-)) transporter
MMSNALTAKWLYIFSAIFIALMGVGIYYEFFYVLLLPFALTILWAAIYKLDYLIFFVILFTPFSINLEELELGGIGMYLPTEPLLFGILILFLFKLLSGKSIDKKILTHPVSYIIYAYLAWMALTSVTSELPIVSIKYLTTRMWFIASFFFLLTHIFKEKIKIRNYFLFYLFPLTLVIIYTVTRHAQYGFDKDSAHWVMEPLFKDHTSYVLPYSDWSAYAKKHQLTSEGFTQHWIHYSYSRTHIVIHSCCMDFCSWCSLFARGHVV